MINGRNIKPYYIIFAIIFSLMLFIPIYSYAQLDLDKRQIIFEDKTLIKSGHTKPITDIVLFNQGNQLATSSTDNTIKIWDTGTEDIIYELYTEEFGLYSMDVTEIEVEDTGDDSPRQSESLNIIVSGGEKNITVWNATKGYKINEWQAHKSSINSIFITDDNNYIISASTDRTVKVWDFKTYQLEMETNAISTINYALSDAGNNLVYLALENGDIDIRNFSNGDPADLIEGHLGGVNHLAIDYDKRFIYSVADDGILMTWTLDGFMEVDAEDFQTALNEIIIDKTNSRLLIGSISGIFAYDPNEADDDLADDRNEDTDDTDNTGADDEDTDTRRSEQYISTSRQKMKEIAYDEESGMIYGGGSESVVVAFDSELQEQSDFNKPVSYPLGTLSVSPDEDLITASGENNEIYVWSLSEGELIHTIENLSDRGTKSLIMTSEDKFITADYDNHLRMYQIDDLGETSNIVDISFDKELHKLNFDRTGSQLVFSVDNDVYLIDKTNIESLTQNNITNFRVIGTAFSIYETIPSNVEEAIYLMSWEGKIEKWDYQTSSMISSIGEIGEVDIQSDFLINNNETVLFAGNKNGRIYKINLLTLDRTELVINTDIGSVNSLYYDEAKKLLFVGGDKNIIIGYDLVNDNVSYTLRGHASSINQITGRPTKNQIALISEDGSISLWNTEEVGISAYLRSFDNDQWLIYTPDGYHKPANQNEIVSFYNDSGTLVNNLNLSNNDSVLQDRLNGGSILKDIDLEIRNIAEILNNAWDDIKSDRLEEAQIKLQEADNLIDPDRHELAVPFYYQVEGEFFVALEQYRNATDTFRTALQYAETQTGLDHLKGNVNRSIGDVYLVTEDFENAKTYYEKAMVYAKSLTLEEEAALYLNTAETYLNLNLNETAITYYDKAIALDLSPSRKVELLLQIGEMYSRRGYYEISIQYYVQASEYALSNEEKADVFGKIGDAYYNLGEFEQAIRQYQNQLSLISPTNNVKLLDAYDDLGRAYESNRDYVLAYSTYAEKMNNIEFTNTQEIIDTYYKLIDISIKLRDFQTALKHLETVREFIPDDDTQSLIKNYERTAEIYEEFDQIPRAVRNYTSALNLISPEDIESYYRVARKIALLYENSIQYQNALDTLTNLTPKIPAEDYEKRFENYMDTARIYLKMDDSQSASTYFERASNIARQTDMIAVYDFYEGVGGIYEGIGFNREALQYYQQAYDNIPVNLTRKRVQNLTIQAELYEKLGEIDTAINISNNAVTIAESGDYETQWRLYNTLGRLYTKKENYTESIDSYRTASEKALQMNDNKKYAYSVFMIGIVYEETDRNEKAIISYEEAITSMEKSASLTDDETDLLGDMLFELSDLLRQEKQYDEAINEGEKCLRVMNSTDSYNKAKALLNLGNIYYELGDYQEVKSYYEDALEDADFKNNREYHAKALNNLAVMKAKEGDYEGAIEYYEKSIELKNLNGDFQGTINTYWNLAILYEKMSRFNKAIDTLEEAIFLIENYDLENGEEFAEYIAELKYIRRELYKTTGTIDELDEAENDAGDVDNDENSEDGSNTVNNGNEDDNMNNQDNMENENNDENGSDEESNTDEDNDDENGNDEENSNDAG